jgi:hypothetical protein
MEHPQFFSALLAIARGSAPDEKPKLISQRSRLRQDKLLHFALLIPFDRSLRF